MRKLHSLCTYISTMTFENNIFSNFHANRFIITSDLMAQRIAKKFMYFFSENRRYIEKLRVAVHSDFSANIKKNIWFKKLHPSSVKTRLR